MIEEKKWRIIDIINWGDQYFSKNGITNSRLEIEWFICHILNCQRIDLYIKFDNILNQENLHSLREMITRRLKNEPFQHIVEKASFFGRDFFVNNNVLIPRPETKLLIERLKLKKHADSIIDIGTGSGCIAITIALEQLSKNIFATDISSAAIDIAKKNMKKFNINNINFFLHDFLNSSFDKKFDIVISNPPYIAKNKIDNLQLEVKNYDPEIALTDFNDGLTFYKRFAKEFHNLVKKGGILLLEIGGNEQKYYIKNIFNENNLITSFFKDLQGEWRVVEVKSE